MRTKFYNSSSTLSPKGSMILILVIALSVFSFNMYIFLRSYGYKKTTAIITDFQKDEYYYVPDEDNSSREKIFPKITYKVCEKEYNVVLRSVFSSPFKKKKVGLEINIKYDPENPEKVVENADGFHLCMMIASAILFVIPIYIRLKNKKKLEMLKEH